MKKPLLRPLLALLIVSGINAAETTTAELVLDPDTQITLREGFDAELLYEVPESQGSWVAMAFDPKGRLIVSDQDDKGVFRVTLAKDDTELAVEPLEGFPYLPINWGKRKVGGALGFLHAFDSLYMSSMKGFYRIRDTDGDDQYDEFKLIKKLGVGYEHSAHSIILSEDEKSLYLVTGNHTPIPEDIPTLQPPVWQQDSLLPAMPDPMGHAVSIRPPAGWICKISPDGSDWKMIASGFRNPVDLALNQEGELFTFDSDLEFDIGSPWYRPTRVNHVTSASEFGWRSGSAKWQEYFADSNGAVVNVGPGSPTGISFGHHSTFPSEYQSQLFVCDWTFGTIYTIAMQESGSSYTGTKREFLHGTPLNISAMRFGPDGHMYFLTGGRNTSSKLYRIRSISEPPTKTPPVLTKNQTLRNLRHSLETHHQPEADGQGTINKCWPYLAHQDRNIRYAARLAIENQDLALWQEKVLSEKNNRVVIYAAIALSRHGNKDLSSKLIAKLNHVPFELLTPEDRLALLRAYSLCFIRLDQPTQDEIQSVTAKLSPFYPAKSDSLNIELCRVLSFLDAPSVGPKTIALMKATQAKTVAFDKEMLDRHEFGKSILEMMSNAPNSQNIQYAYSLRRVQNGWTLEDRKYYFGWLNDTLEKSGGKSFAGYIRAIREDAIANLPAAEAASISWLLGEIAPTDLSQLPLAEGPPVIWTVESASKLFDVKLRGRNFENGKKMFAAGRCVACHRYDGSGGYSGPDLGSVGNRFSIKDILVAVCEPSQSISEQYQASDVTLKDGKSLYGRIIYKNDKEIAVAPNPYNFGEIIKTPIDQVQKVAWSQNSMMPVGTIYPMNAEELKDLVAYLISTGNPKHPAFTKE